MLLILTEKPSAARNFAKAFGGRTGSFDGEHYKIANLRGHLLGLRKPHEQVPDDQTAQLKSWNLDLMPWDLSDFAWKKAPYKGCTELLKSIRDDLSGVDEVAIATDDDPSGEGEVLAWEALDWCKWNGQTSRMYFTDETPNSLHKAFRNRVAIDSKEKDGDFQKGTVRERWDLASMQFTRIATEVASQHGCLPAPQLRQGRLKSVITKLVGDQQAAYEDYVKKPFFEARFKDANGNVFSRKVEDLEEIRFPKAEDVDLSCLHESTITEDSRAKKRTAPGKLLDLAGMSAILAKQGLRPDAVMATYQSMYEDLVVSYPRTEDKFVSPEQFNEMLPWVDKIAMVVGVDPALLTHREPRKSHVKEGGAHGANRPGANVPDDLSDLTKYGKEGPAIYELLAKNFLAILAPDYEYELVRGHVTEFPEFVGETKVPVFPGFKAVFDSEAESDDDGNKESTAEFANPAIPYVHEGANKRPSRPTMKWLNKRLEKHNVGTGATRTSTLAEISKDGDERAMLKERKGVLTLTDCGKVSFTLLDGCQIAEPKATADLNQAMKQVGKFELDGNSVIDTVTAMVVHDKDVMIRNGARLKELGIKGTHGNGSRTPATVIGKCPKCGADLLLKEKSVQCSTNRRKKDQEGNFQLVAGCGFSFNRTKNGKKLTQKQVEKLVSEGRTGLVKGFTSKNGKPFDGYVTLDPETGKTGFEFPERKPRRRG